LFRALFSSCFLKFNKLVQQFAELVRFISSVKKHISHHNRDEPYYNPQHEICPDYQDAQNKHHQAVASQNPDEMIDFSIQNAGNFIHIFVLIYEFYIFLL
jgi:hypothetical protein